MRLLLAEDDDILGQGIEVALSQEHYAVDWFREGQQADQALQTEPYDMIVLDLGLPKLSGLEVLKRLRQRQNTTPVLILTARDSVDDRVKGLDQGADDYLIKPFDLAELYARLRALQRRHSGQSQPMLEYGDIQLNPASHQVFKQKQMINLPRRAFDLLHILLQHQDKIFSRTQLEEKLYAWNEEIESNAIEVYIHQLRKKLGNQLIRNIRGMGYVIHKKTQ